MGSTQGPVGPQTKASGSVAWAFTPRGTGSAQGLELSDGGWTKSTSLIHCGISPAITMQCKNL
jgi:hypothetical protein